MTSPQFICHVCASHDSKKYASKNGYTLMKCGICSHVQVTPIPKEEDLAGLYKNVTDDSFYGNGCSTAALEKYNKDKGFLMNFFSERIDIVNLLGLSRQAKILDFGCTNGIFVRSLKDAGYNEVYGYDIAEDLVADGVEMGLKLFSGDLERLSLAKMNVFDLVITYYVFEHLASPQFALRQLRRMLTTDGYLVISVPYINSLQGKAFGTKSPIIDPPYHIHYFTISSMHRLLHEHGFKIISTTTPFWTKFTDVYLTLKGFNERLATFLRYMAFPLTGIMRWSRLGGTLVVIAQKSGR